MKNFYHIFENKDGTVNVYLEPGDEKDAVVGDTEFSVVRGVVPWEHLEDEIRMRFDDWCDAGEKIVI